MTGKCAVLHNLITCPLNERDRLEELAKEADIQDILGLQYGTHIILIIAWLRQKIELKSADIESLMSGNPRSKATARRLWKIALSATVPGERALVFGGNIILPKGEHILLAEVTQALQLLNPEHPIQILLQDVCKKHYTINYLDYKGLEELIQLIKFPITSLAALILSLGYKYLVGNQYLDKGIIIGTTNSNSHEMCALYGRGKYKIMPFNTFMFLASQDALTTPLSEYEACQLGVFTNHISKET